MLLPDPGHFATMAVDACRTNVRDVFEAIACENRYPAAHFPDANFNWSLGLMVEDMFAVADAAGLERFHLVGESIGGTVALAAAIARPDRIATLTVSNGAHLGATIGRVMVRGRSHSTNRA